VPVSRWYLPSAGTAPLTSLAYDTVWNRTVAATRHPTSGTKISTAMANRTMTSTATSPELHCGAQFQSVPIAAQTISGTVKGQIRTGSNNGPVNLGQLSILIKIVSNDGTVTRGYLIGATPAHTNLTTSPPRIPTATTPGEINRKFMDSSDNTNIPLSSVVAEENDRIIIEIGSNDNTTGTTNSRVVIGDDSATDLAEDETSTLTDNPWIEFSSAILLAGEGAPTLISVFSRDFPTPDDDFDAAVLAQSLAFAYEIAPPPVIIVPLFSQEFIEPEEVPDFSALTQSFTFEVVPILITPIGNAILAPYEYDETWEEHFLGRSWLTIQDQIDAGYPYYAQPVPENGYYEEIFDYGAVFNNVIVNLDWSTIPVTGTVLITVSISHSADGLIWSSPTIGSSLFVPSFRFLKVKVEFLAAN
jgi:hypothetical protein